MIDLVIRWDWIFFAMKIVFVMFVVGKIWNWGRKSASHYKIDDYIIDGSDLVKVFARVNRVIRPVPDKPTDPPWPGTSQKDHMYMKACTVDDYNICLNTARLEMQKCSHTKHCKRYYNMITIDDPKWPRE